MYQLRINLNIIWILIFKSPFITGFFNNDFSSSGVELLDPDKELIKTVDLLGREGVFEGFLVDVFDDGTVLKKYIIKQ